MNGHFTSILGGVRESLYENAQHKSGAEQNEELIQLIRTNVPYTESRIQDLPSNTC